MRFSIKCSAACGFLLCLLLSTQSAAESQALQRGAFETFGKIERVDSAARSLWVHGQRFRLAPNLVVHGLSSGNALRPGLEIGYIEGSEVVGDVGIITHVWVTSSDD